MIHESLNLVADWSTGVSHLNCPAAYPFSHEHANRRNMVDRERGLYVQVLSCKLKKHPSNALYNCQDKVRRQCTM